MTENLEQSREHVSPTPATSPHDLSVGLHVAYLINQYPKVSHSFIRREILEAENQGIEVLRIALRGWDEPLVDPLDIAERTRTTYILEHGWLPLIAAVFAALRRPRSFLHALGAAIRMSRRSIRPLPYHLVYLAHACRIKQLLEDKPVAHLHAHFGTNSAEVALLLRLLGGPTYSFTVHGADEADDGKYLHLDEKVGHAKFVVAVSAYTRAQLLRHISPADWDKVHVVHCGLDSQSFADPHTTDVAAEPVVLCIGRLSAEKGHLILLDAFGRIAARRPEARLVLAGDGPLRPLIEARIADLGLRSRVRITGWISSETIREEILAARVLVQPSLQEGLPVVLMEAMAMGRPVISTYVAGIPELVVPGEVGWLVPAGDADALAGAMEKSLVLSEDELRRMGVAANARARERHSINREVKKLAALFAGMGMSVQDGADVASERTSPMGFDPKRLAKSVLTSKVLYGPLRALALREDPVTVLCYHTLRPDDEPIDAWTAVRVSDFLRQITFLRAHYDIVSLDDAFDAPRTSGGRPRAVVTFDDGEVGLYDSLLPLVSELRLPVTLYIATGQIEAGRAYWFDEVMNALQADGPFTIDLTAAGLRAWTVSPERGARRWTVIADILEALKGVRPERRSVLADAVIAQAPALPAASFKPLAPLSVAQLGELAGSEWVTIAAHSHCHNLLDQIPATEVRESLSRSRALLEAWAKKPALHFAYPNGNHNPTVEKIVSDFGFASAFALDNRLWHRGMDRFVLPRVCIGRYDDLSRFKLRLIGI